MGVEVRNTLGISTRERRLALGFAGVIMYFYAPPLLSAYNDFRGGSIPGSLLLGSVPGVTFPVLADLALAVRTGPADSPAWAMTLAFLAIGIVGAGIVFSRILQWIIEQIGNSAQ